MENERFPSRCCRPHHKRRSRELYRDGDSSVVRNTVIKVVIMAMTMGRTIWSKTNCRLNHCRRSTSIMSASLIETRQADKENP